MSGIEIREKIMANNKLIEDSAGGLFVLNKKVNAALEENKKLRQMCHHEFDDTGYCIYCDFQKVGD